MQCNKGYWECTMKMQILHTTNICFWKLLLLNGEIIALCNAWMTKPLFLLGNPYKPTPAVSRAHHRGLVNTNSANLTTDHDYHICGIVPSVCLFVDIPDNSRGSFYHGDVHITLKDNIFQPSTPFRHAAETVKIVRSYFSEDDVNANKPIIVRYTDGGPDHRPTLATAAEQHQYWNL